MKNFKPCLGKQACNNDGTYCRVCGRTDSEIQRTRQLIDELADFIETSKYVNYDDFARYIARKVVHKIQYRREHEG